MVRVVDRCLNGLVEQRLQDLDGGLVSGQQGTETRLMGLPVTVQGLAVQSIFVAKGIVQAGSVNAQAIYQILNRRGLVTPMPEQVYGPVKNRFFIKCTWTSHN